MMVLFREVAEADLEEAIAYYEAIDPDLALRFQDELALAIQRIDDQPEAHLVVHADVRRARLNRFPHAVYYRVVDQNTVVIVACIHPSRDPTICRTVRLLPQAGGSPRPIPAVPETKTACRRCKQPHEWSGHR